MRRRYLGDIVLTQPVFFNLRQHWPNALITVVVDEGNGDLLKWNRDVTEVLELPRRRAGESNVSHASRWMKFVRLLRAKKYTLVFDLTPNKQSAVVTWLTGAPRRVSYWLEDQRGWRHRFYNALVYWSWKDHASMHMVDLLLRQLEVVNVPIVSREVHSRVPDDAAAEAQRELARLIPHRTGPVLLVHPGARVAARVWPPENYARAIDEVIAAWGAHVIVTGGKADEPLLNTIRTTLRTDRVVFAEPMPVLKFAALASQTDLFVGNDSGPMHLVAAVGTPVVAVFDAQLPTLWGPVGSGHVVVRASQPCTACIAPDLCRPPVPDHMYCVRRITVDEVVSAISRQLDRRGFGRA